MSKTWEVFTQSSEPEAHVKNARQTKKYKTGWPLAYINTIIKSLVIGPAMTGAAILSSLSGIPSGPAGFRTFRLERISETRATLTG